MAVRTDTGQLSPSTATAVTVPAKAEVSAPYYRMCQVTNENGSAAIIVAWGQPTVADPPTSLDGSTRVDMLILPASANAKEMFRLPTGACQVKLMSTGTPRYIMSVFDELM